MPLSFPGVLETMGFCSVQASRTVRELFYLKAHSNLNVLTHCDVKSEARKQLSPVPIAVALLSLEVPIFYSCAGNSIWRKFSHRSIGGFAQTGEQDLVRQRERAVNLAPLHLHLSLVPRVNPDVSLNAFFTVCVQEGIGRTCDK